MTPQAAMNVTAKVGAVNAAKVAARNAIATVRIETAGTAAETGSVIVAAGCVTCPTFPSFPVAALLLFNLVVAEH